MHPCHTSSYPRPLAVALLLVLLVSPAHAERCGGPSLNKLVSAILARSGLTRRQAASWRRRLRWSAMLPRLTAHVARSSGWSENWDLAARNPGQDLRNYLGLRWQVRASWDLSRLVFDGREVSVSRRRSQLGVERRRLMREVIRLYYERCSLMQLLGNKTPAAAAKRERLRGRLREITALLDVLSGGVLGGTR